MLHTCHEHKCKETELLTKQLRCFQNWKILYFNNCIQHLLCFSITGKIFKKYTAHNADALDIMWFVRPIFQKKAFHLEVISSSFRRK